jgi:Domain of unknown function (DUF4440)
MKKRKILIVIALGIAMGNENLFSQQPFTTSVNNQNMVQIATKNDETILSRLNNQFIKNFINMDTATHNEIIHKDFVCINGDGTISGRIEYMEDWSQGYKKAGYTSFYIKDENIRLFGDMALVRSKTVYTKMVNGNVVNGNSIYTDTYVRENGRWWCVQAHITPVK